MQHCSTTNLGGVPLFTIHSYSIASPPHSIAMFQRMMIWKFPSRTSLVHHQSWWCASFRYSCNCNRMPTSVDIHISKDDGMKMSFNTSLPLLVNCFLLSFLQMQLYAQSINIHVSKDDDMKMSFRYIFAPQSVLVSFCHSFKCNYMPTSINIHFS